MRKKICSIENCTSTIPGGRGWCNRHYKLWLRNGDPTKNIHFRDPEESFKKRTKWVAGCLVWTGSIDTGGYGEMVAYGKSMPVHRYAWERVNGPIDEGLFVDHICYNRACSNVDHLRLVTNQQNMWNRPGATRSSSSGVRNVYPHYEKWTVRVKKDYTLHYFGVFDTIEEASEVAEKAREELFGEYAGRGAA